MHSDHDALWTADKQTGHPGGLWTVQDDMTGRTAHRIDPMRKNTSVCCKATPSVFPLYKVIEAGGCLSDLASRNECKRGAWGSEGGKGGPFSEQTEGPAGDP